MQICSIEGVSRSPQLLMTGVDQGITDAFHDEKQTSSPQIRSLTVCVQGQYNGLLSEHYPGDMGV